jgi:ferredoxin-like protein FixX
MAAKNDMKTLERMLDAANIEYEIGEDDTIQTTNVVFTFEDNCLIDIVPADMYEAISEDSMKDELDNILLRQKGVVDFDYDAEEDLEHEDE